MTRTEVLDRLLARMASLQERAAADIELGRQLHELRLWQAKRLEQTYGALRQQPRFVGALDFFLTDLYGPNDFTRREPDVKRALRQLKRALPARLVELLCMAAELQVLTLELDEQMACMLEGHPIDAGSYAAAYRAVDRAADRERQIDLIVRIGEDLGDIVQQHWLGVALRAARLPAQVAGLKELQGFLERGFRAFRKMGDAHDLLAAIRLQETSLMKSLFCGDASPLVGVARGTAANE